MVVKKTAVRHGCGATFLCSYIGGWLRFTVQCCIDFAQFTVLTSLNASAFRKPLKGHAPTYKDQATGCLGSKTDSHVMPQDEQYAANLTGNFLKTNSDHLFTMSLNSLQQGAFGARSFLPSRIPLDAVGLLK